VPWCERCSRFLNPNTIATDGSCPSCGRTVEVAERPADQTSPTAVEVDTADEGVKAPWHFWVMVIGVAVYLGWRLIQGIFWAAHNWF